MRFHRFLVSCSVASLLYGSSAQAHVSVAGPAYAGSSQVLTFSVGHGCEGADTYKLEVQIPAEVATVRVLPSAFAEAELSRNAADVVSSVAWSKSTVRARDDQYYQFAIRISVPDLPFQKLYFRATQYCRSAEGVESTVAWAATPEEIAAAPMGQEPEPAPELLILPKRRPGWNKFTVPAKIDKLSLFDDAHIVWVGSAAYSANPATMDQIKAEADVQVLSEIPAASEIWVKY